MSPTKDIRKYYRIDEKCLFVGNGPNQLHRLFSWDDLLKNICRAAGLRLERRQKAFPLFFEEISYALNPNRPVEENIKELKGLIGQEALKLNPHQLLIDVIEKKYYHDYLTTNYDYCIERAIDPAYDPASRKASRWPKYSLYRYNDVGSHKIWHIHGECLNGFSGKKNYYPESSIMIGFEHYSDYLEKIHHFIKNNGKGLHDLIQKELDAGQPNWIHLFFIRDIDIIGFGMDYTESHLWFILNFRARLKRSGVDVPNTIRWIIPMFQMKNQQDKVDLLRALEVEVNYVTGPKNDYSFFYESFASGLR